MTKTPTSKNEKPSWFTKAITQHQYIKEILPNMMDDPFKSIFINILNKYVVIGVMVFPQQAKTVHSRGPWIVD